MAPEKPQATGVGWPLVIGVMVGSFVLGALLFRSKPAPLDRAPTVANSAVTPLAAKVAPHGEAVSTVQGDDRDRLLTDLRAKLPKSVEDVLRELTELAKTNPALAIDLAQELGRTDEEKSQWVKNTMQQWAERDSQAAWQWLGQLSKDRMQQLAGGELTAVVLGAMAAKDPSKVVANLDNFLRNGNPSESVSTPVAVHVGLQSLIAHGQIDLARSVLDGWAKDPAKLNLEAAAYESVAMELAKTAPQETGAWLRSLPATEERDASIATFTATWAEHDPRAALQWAETLPPGDMQQAAFRRTVSDWIERYPSEVSGWLGDYLARVPPSTATDSLVETVINVSPTMRATPQLALQWTNLVSDPAKRAADEETVALRWGAQNSAAAADYVWKSRTIPPERKAALVQKIQAPHE
jgi:hypothetical protein